MLTSQRAPFGVGPRSIFWSLRPCGGVTFSLGTVPVPSLQDWGRTVFSRCESLVFRRISSTTSREFFPPTDGEIVPFFPTLVVTRQGGFSEQGSFSLRIRRLSPGMIDSVRSFWKRRAPVRVKLEFGRGASGCRREDLFGPQRKGPNPPGRTAQLLFPEIYWRVYPSKPFRSSKRSFS